MLSNELQMLLEGAKEAAGNVEKALLTLEQTACVLEGLVKDARAMEVAQLPMAMQLKEGEGSDKVVVLNRWAGRS